MKKQTYTGENGGATRAAANTDEKLYDQGFGVQVETPRSRGLLNDRNVIPPFSTWNTREGFWQDRRRRWLALGIKSEAGRAGKLTYNIPMQLKDGSTGNKIRSQTSIFDPVVCELAYRWWARPGDVVLDPFAGGSVRGVVASVMGLKYHGIELRAEQVEANTAQMTGNTRGRYAPRWVCGDSAVAVAVAPVADFILSCPPYGNLEVYSDDPKDISNRGYEEFLVAYNGIIRDAVARLRNDRFIVWVVANYRDTKTGRMIDFVGDSIRAFGAAGANYYNDIILINSIGTAAMRANTNFVRGARKVVKVHQNVLVFYKGDPRAAAARLPADVLEYSDE